MQGVDCSPCFMRIHNFIMPLSSNNFINTLNQKCYDSKGACVRPSKHLWCFLLGVLQGVKLVCADKQFV